jgi:ComF family protein
MRRHSVDAWLRRVQRRTARSMWPSQCVLCGRLGVDEHRDLCAGCECDLPKNHASCDVCAEPLQATAPALTCGECIQRPPRFDVCLAPYRYAYPLDHMIRSLKYGGAVAHGRVLGELVATQLQAMPHDRRPQALLPVPLAAGRFRKRGYNQATVLAELLQRHLAIPLHTNVLARTRETLEQAGLDQRARRRNIRGAFSLVRDSSAAHVAIIDDVVTTGSTVNEIARVLKRAGVIRVDVWAVARAGRSVS